VESVWRALGHQPKSTDMHPPLSVLSANAYKRRFGSWRKALEGFVEFLNQPPASSTNNEPPSIHTPVVVGTQQSKSRKTSRPVSWRMRFIVMRRDNFKCKLCGASPALNPGVILVVDHVDPSSAGGETELDNLQTLCVPCNGGKSDLPLQVAVLG